MKYTSNDLINAIKRNGSIPTSQIKFSTSDFLYFLNEELELTIVGELLATREDYFVTTSTTALIANQSGYDLPSSAVGWKLEGVGYLDSDSNYTKLPLVTKDQRNMYNYTTSSSIPSAIYVSGNKVYTVPDMGSSPVGSLQYDFVRIQNKLVALGDCGTISIVTDTGTDYQMNVDSSPVGSGVNVDVISGTNPFNVIARNVTATVAGALVTVTYGDDFVREPVAGDYICAVGTTPVPNIPEDFHSVLAQAATIRCLIAMNDSKGIQTATLALGNMFQRMKTRASSRVNNAPQKILGRSHVRNAMRFSTY